MTVSLRKMVRTGRGGERSKAGWDPGVEDWNWETIFYGEYRSIFNHCDIISLQNYRNLRKNAKHGLLRRSMSFKVIKVSANRKPACDFLLVINSN